VVKPLRCCLPLLLTWGAQAMAADALPIKLGWTAPPECGDAQAVERDVRSMLGEASIPASRPPIEAEVILRRAADAKWDVTLQTRPVSSAVSEPCARTAATRRAMRSHCSLL